MNPGLKSPSRICGIRSSTAQHRPEPPRITFIMISGFTPALVPSVNASDMLIRLIADINWFATFTTCPAPHSPQWIIFLPTTSKFGIASLTSSSLPPAIIVSVPFMAPDWPPLTGPSTNLMPMPSSFFPISFVTSGDMLLMSIMKKSSGRSPLRSPFSPSSTSSTWGEFGSIVITVFVCFSMSHGLSTATTFSCIGSILILSWFTSQAISVYPAFRRFSAIP